jgi:hypothetical protein
MQLIIDRVKAHPKRAWSSPRARRRRRSVPPLAWRNAGLGRPILIGREEHIAETLKGMGLGRPRRHRHPERPAQPAQPRLCRVPLPAQPAQRPALSRLPAAGQPGPQRLRRLHGGLRPCRCHGDRPHPPLQHRDQGHPLVVSPLPRRRCSASPSSSPGPDRLHRRHHGARAARRPRSPPTSPSRPPRSPAAWASCRGSPSSPSPPSATQGQQGRPGQGRRAALDAAAGRLRV